MPRKARKKPLPAGLPSREAILAFIADHPGKAGKREIARAFNVTGADRIGLKRLLKEMADDGQIGARRGKLRRPGDLPSVTVLRIDRIDHEGDLIAVPLEWNAEWGDAPLIVIATETGRKARRDRMAGIGDRVLARLAPDGENGGFLARIIEVLPKPPTAVLGVYRETDREARIVPISRRARELPVEPGGDADAEDGELVTIEVTHRGRYRLPQARVIERIGGVSSEKAISLIALEEHGIPYVFPPDVVAEADSIQPFRSSAGEGRREDWRDLPLVTIDPPDARDHDDAVHAMPDPDNPGGHIVTVAIADVAWYVRAASNLDREAVKRGNSVYFPGRVVPMLPERISNDLCSLRQGEDRPAMAVRMTFNADGRKTGHRFHRVMMRSAARLSYDEAQAAIDGTPDERTTPLLEPVLKPLWSAYRALAKARDERKPLAIDMPERKVVLTQAGAVDRIIVPPRQEAHRLIEEFMIQANVCAAETLESKRAPLVYRVHDEPSYEKLDALRDFLASLDMRFSRSGTVRPEQFNHVLAKFRGTANAILVNEVVLRSQAQAEYAVDNIGHFGLNLRRYAHFTSPIRRYADLIVHRALIAALRLGAGGIPAADEPKLERIAAEISLAERRAMKAERDTVDRLIAAWLADRVGARFAGHVRGVTRAGLFVELDETGADGFVPVTTLGKDYFEYHADHHRLVGRETGETFRLGDAVEVRLVEALPFAGAMRFEMESEGHFPPRKERRKPAGGNSRRKPAKRSGGRKTAGGRARK
ncbi:MAG TPA: ribonuclease R [Afifellaceae bacterium]|nr:ribonuclease R [Afifellaceae bacterium]